MRASTFSLRRAVVAVACSALAASCTPPRADLAGDPWTVRTIDGHPATAPASLVLQDGHATGNTGCNPYSGSAKISGDDITFGPMITIKMACLPQARMEQEASLLAAFAAIAHWRMDNGALVLSDTQDRERLRLTRP
jgi:heat shock protein HslJ